MSSEPSRSLIPIPPRLLAWIILPALFFAAVAPTLSWLEFSGSVENLNIATALELRRDHPDNWLIPSLEGEARIKKPPLTAWATALAIRPATVAALSDSDSSKQILRRKARFGECILIFADRGQRTSWSASWKPRI